jgi:aminoglycoside 6'-N-acetyltransferase
MTTSTALRGERLALEPLHPEHADRLRALRDAPEVARWWGPAPEGWPLAGEDDVDVKLTITVGDDVAGFVHFFEEPDPNARHADVDVFLGAAYQGRGLGAEALALVLDHLRGARGHHRVTLYTAPANERAIRTYERLGFRRVGVLRKSQRSAITGEWEDELLMELVW